MVRHDHQLQVRDASRPRGLGRRAFTLIDVLVTISIIAILIGLLIPSLRGVNESARRLLCRSNQRQIGLALAMYADANKGFIPVSQFLAMDLGHGFQGRAPAPSEPQQMVILRVASDEVDVAVSTTGWDGLGLLHEGEYLSNAEVFYCPSHSGDHAYGQYATLFDQPAGEIVSNFQYRGVGPVARQGSNARTNNLFRIDPANSSLMVDGLRTQFDYNHRVGANVFRADLSVGWYSDEGGLVAQLLAKSKEESESSQAAVNIEAIWNRLDTAPLIDRLR